MKSRSYSGREGGDNIFISIIDEYNNTIFKGHAHINDKKGLRNLMKDLTDKGINLKSKVDWLD